MVVVQSGPARTDLLTDRARAFGSISDVDALGTFRLPRAAILDEAVHPDVAPAVRLFLPRLSNGAALSRGERYYDIRSALLVWPVLLTACRHLSRAEDEIDRRVTLALYENLFNVVAAMTFSYWERCCDEPDGDDARSSVLASLVASLPDVARLHLGAALGRDLAGAPPAIDWEILESIGTRFPRGWRLRSLREFDNKTRVLNEVLYLRSEVSTVWPFHALVFPLYGALTLAAYFSAVECLSDGVSSERSHVAVMVRLGLYDRGPTSFTTPEGCLDVDRLLPRPWLDDARRALCGRRVLIVDDNAATGRTLQACREFVMSCGGVPLTRSAETSWELLERQPAGRPCFKGVDLPGLRTNLSHAWQCTMIDLLVRRRFDQYAGWAERLGRSDFSAGLTENYRTARASGSLRPRQRSSVEQEWVHARRHWREPGYPSLRPVSDHDVSGLPREGFPAGVWPWCLTGSARTVDAVPGGPSGGPTILGDDSFVLQAASVHTVRVAVPGPGRLELRLGGWSTALAVTAGDGSRGAIEVDVIAPQGTGAHDLVMRFLPLQGQATERRYPVHVVTSAPTGAVVAESTTLVVGEGALEAETGRLLQAALEVGATVLVLAQEPEASAALPIPARLEPMPLCERSLVRFTTHHHALPSLPRHRVLSFEDAAMLPTAVFTRLGNGPWADEVSVGVLATDGSLRATVVGAHHVGKGRVIVCQLRITELVAARHPGAVALRTDLLRWACAPRRAVVRDDVELADGRSMSFYPFVGDRR